MQTDCLDGLDNANVIRPVHNKDDNYNHNNKVLIIILILWE